MKRLDIDFAPEPAWRRWVGVALLALLLVAAGVESFEAWRAHARWSELRDALDAAQERSRAVRAAQAASTPAAASASAPTLEQVRRRAENERLRKFELDTVLVQIEAARIPGAKATAIDLDPRSRSASIDIEAPSLNEVQAYLDALNAGQGRCRWSLDRASDSDGKKVARLLCQEAN